MSRTFFIALTACAVLLVTPNVNAEDVNITFKSGGTLTGSLLEFITGHHVTVGLGAGKTLQIRMRDITAIEIDEGGGPPCSIQVDIDMKGGGEVSGPVLEYVLRDHVLIALGTGPYRLNANEVQFVRIKGGYSPNCAGRITAASQALPRDQQVPLPAEQPSAHINPSTSEAVRAATVQGLMAERADWRSRSTSIAAPLVTTSIAVVALGVGFIFQVLYQNSGSAICGTSGCKFNPKDTGLNTGSIAALIGGGALLGTSMVLWLVRTSESEQQEELQRIDERLRFLGVQASLAPWLLLPAKQSGGSSGGVRLSLRF
jgi:hypothetical protein